MEITSVRNKFNDLDQELNKSLVPSGQQANLRPLAGCIYKDHILSKLLMVH